MKNIVLLFVLLSQLGLAQKPFDLKIEVSDAYTGEPAEGLLLSLVNTKSGAEFKLKSDRNGTFHMKELEGSNFEVKITDARDNYRPKAFELYHLKKTKVETYDLKMYPSDRILSEWIAKEDSIYGEVKDSKETIVSSDSTANKCDSLNSTEAEFPEGIQNMMRYINQNVNYPQESIEMNEQGRVYLSYVIEKDGAISHVKVVRGVSDTLDQESIRLVRQMPNWKPGTCNDKAVRTRIKMPISFTLN